MIANLAVWVYLLEGRGSTVFGSWKLRGSGVTAEVKNVWNIRDPNGTTVPEANHSPRRSEAYHSRVLASEV